ncbi:MAG: hypothetical protein AAGI38_05100, partial [Bacteroidota bacterium]
MKQLIIGIICVFLFSSFGLGQERASEARQKLMKNASQPAVSIILTGSQKNVSHVVKEKIKAATGKKSKAIKGSNAYLGVYLKRIYSSTMDVYFTLDKMGSKEVPQTRVNLFLSTGNENFMDSGKYPEVIENAKTFLEELPREVKIYELELAIADQQKTIDKTVKDYERMGRDSVNLEIQRVETLQAIDQNKLDREN